jgi:hypothetical protein
VGFISELPTQLIAAFQSTLEELLHADVLLHVRDVSSPNFAQQKEVVVGVLREIGVSEETLTERTIEVWSKVDLVERQELLQMMATSAPLGRPAASEVPPSAMHDVVPQHSHRSSAQQNGQRRHKQAAPEVFPCAVVPISSVERTGFDRLLREVESLCIRAH